MLNSAVSQILHIGNLSLLTVCFLLASLVVWSYLVRVFSANGISWLYLYSDFVILNSHYNFHTNDQRTTEALYIIDIFDGSQELSSAT